MPSYISRSKSLKHPIVWNYCDSKSLETIKPPHVSLRYFPIYVDITFKFKVKKDTKHFLPLHNAMNSLSQLQSHLTFHRTYNRFSKNLYA